MEAATEPVMDWVAAHEDLVGIARRRAEFDFREAAALLRAFRTDAHRHLGYGSFAEYVERLFGYATRTTEDKLRTATTLENLPELQRSLLDGAVNWSTARELARVATTATEREWLDAASGKTVRQIEQLVSGRVAGDRPSDPARAGATRHTLRFDVSADTYATFREAVAHLRRQSPDRLDDDALLLLLSREILQGPTEAGRANYQIAVTTCDHCARTFQQGGGALVDLEPELVAMAECDAQRIGRVSGCVGESTHVGAPKASQEVPPTVRRRVVRREHGRCAVPGCTHTTFVDLHHLTPRTEGGPHDDDNLILLCVAHHRAAHRGLLAIEGRPSVGLRFRNAVGASYGDPPPARGVAAREKAFRALRRLGFREKEARQALDGAARDATPPAGADVEVWIRAALALLVPAPPEGVGHGDAPTTNPPTRMSESTT